MSLADIRRDYALAGLREEDCDPDPIRQFANWFDAVLKSDPADPNAATLATCSADGQPSARIVLIKGFDASGFVFFTNYLSRKGRELQANPRAALCCFWPQFERQVRIEGTVELVSAEESDAYHRTRPRGSQLGAWCSEQSEPVTSRAALEQRLQQLEEQYRDTEVPRPPHWGGYRLKPHTIEFWQGRLNRLHDRIRYRLIDGNWVIDRLSP